MNTEYGLTKDEVLHGLREIAARQGDPVSDEDHFDVDCLLLGLIDDDEIGEAFGAIKIWSA